MNNLSFKNKTFFKDGIEEVKLLEIVDADTVYFLTKNGKVSTRLLGINAPEKTKRIEPYGLEADKFARTRLENASSIVIEVDSNKPELDSTRKRYLCYVWYKDSLDEEYKLFNSEILEAGLAKLLIMDNVTKYNDLLESSFKKAKDDKIKIHGEIDPNFKIEEVKTSIKMILNNKDYYSNCQTLVLKGIVTRKVSSSLFLMYEGFSIYVYNTYYDISKFEVGDLIELKAQFSKDLIYGNQLTNIRDVCVKSSNNKYDIPVLTNKNDLHKYIGYSVVLKDYKVIEIEKTKKSSNTYALKVRLSNGDILSIKVSSGIKPKVKADTFVVGKIYSSFIGIIEYRTSFESERYPSLLLCNGYDEKR